MDPLLAEIKQSGADTIPKQEPATLAAPTPTPAASAPNPTPTPDPAPAPAPAPAASAEPAKTDPPAVDPPAPTPDEGVDYAKYLQEKSGGRIASEEELTKIIQERDQLEEQLKNSPELDDYTLKLDAWRKKGYDVELFHTIHDMPIDELSAEDKVKASLKLQNPEWMEEDINLYLKNKYGILAPEDEGYDEAKSRYGKMQLDIDAKTADQELRSLQGMTAFSQEDEQAVYQAETDRQQAWTAGLPKLSENFKKITVALDAEGKQLFDFVPTQNQLNAVVNSLQKAVKNAPVAYDENGIKAVNDLFRKELRDQCFNEIVRAAATRMASLTKEANIQRTHNPSATAEPTPSPPAAKSVEETSVEQIGSFMDGPGKR